MEFITQAWEWLSGPNGVVLFGALFAISEFLGVFDKIQSNGVFQVIKKGIKWILAKLKGIQK